MRLGSTYALTTSPFCTISYSVLGPITHPCLLIQSFEQTRQSLYDSVILLPFATHRHQAGTGFPVHIFMAWRIKVLTKSYLVPVIISILAVVAFSRCSSILTRWCLLIGKALESGRVYPSRLRLNGTSSRNSERRLRRGSSPRQ